MKNIHICIVLGVLLSLCSCTQNAPKEIVLKACAFNTGHFNQGELGGYQGRNVLDTLSIWKDWVCKQGCDIFFLQEWNMYFDKDSAYNAQREILDPYYKNILWGDNNTYIHNGICTNLPLENKRIEHLSTDYYALVADVEIADQKVSLISVHLNWQEEHHMNDLNQFIEFLSGFDSFIAGGDMNASQAEQLLFKQAGFNIANGGDAGFICTWPMGAVKATNYCIDNIVTSTNIEIRHPHSVITNVNDQDHFPILAEIVIKSKN